MGGFYLHVARGELQEQEVSAPHSQKQQPRLAGGSKVHVERRLLGCLRGPQVDVAVSVEGSSTNKHRNTGIGERKQHRTAGKRPVWTRIDPPINVASALLSHLLAIRIQ